MSDWFVANLSTGAVVLQKSGWYGMAERVTCFRGHVLFHQQGKINNLENNITMSIKKRKYFIFKSVSFRYPKGTWANKKL